MATMTKKLVFALLLLLSSVAMAQGDFRIWMAAQVGERFVSNHDVNEYIQNYVLSDKVKSSLFEMSNQDFDAYEKELRELTAKLYADTLDRMIYQRYIEAMATEGSSAKRELFKTTASDFSKKFESVYQAHLKAANVKDNAPINYGAFLQENNYPHARGESAEETYQRWEAALRFKVKEDLRIANVNEAEIALAIKSYPRSYENPDRDIMAPSRYTEKVEVQWKALNGKVFSQADFIAKTTHLDSVVVSELKTLGAHSPVSELKKDSAFFKAQINIIAKALSSKTLITPVVRLGDYLKLAQDLAANESTENLEAEKQKSLQAYIAGSGKGDIVAARIVDLALAIQDGMAEIKEVNVNQLLAQLKSASELQKLALGSTQNLSLSEAIVSSLALGQKAQSTTHQEALVHEVIKSVITKASQETQVKVSVALKKKLTSQEYDQVKSKVRSEFLAASVAHFRKNDIYKRSYLVSRNVTGDLREQGESVIKSILP